MQELKRNKLRTDYGNKTGDKIRTEHYVSFNHDYVKYLEDELLKLLNIGVVMPCCLDCKFWKQISNYEHAINDGNCSKLDRTDKLIINLHLGWEGGYVNDIETDEDFGCRLFERNGA